MEVNTVKALFKTRRRKLASAGLVLAAALAIGIPLALAYFLSHTGQASVTTAGVGSPPADCGYESVFSGTGCSIVPGEVTGGTFVPGESAGAHRVYFTLYNPGPGSRTFTLEDLSVGFESIDAACDAALDPSWFVVGEAQWEGSGWNSVPVPPDLRKLIPMRLSSQDASFQVHMLDTDTDQSACADKPLTITFSI